MTGLAKREAGAIAQQEGNAVLSMIERAARDPAVDIEKMRQLLQMRADEEARVAKRDFNEALAVVQSETSPVAADANNPQTRSKYASYYALDKALRPIYTRHGFALSFDTEPGAGADLLRVICFVSHRSGHTQKYQIDMPADGKGAKGGDVMTKTHAAGSAASYGMRYLLKMIFNVAVGEHDDDGAKAGAGPAISHAQLEQLIAECESVSADKEAFCKYLKIDALADLPASRFQQAMDALAAKRKKAS
jgi:hypothetical protein